MLCGGLDDERPADNEIQQIVDNLTENIQQQTGKNYPHLRAVSYRTQVVAGTNYYIKIDVGDEHIHVRIYEPLPHLHRGPELHKFQEGKTRDEPINSF